MRSEWYRPIIIDPPDPPAKSDLRVAYERLGVVGPYSANVLDHRVKAHDVITGRADDLVRLLSERPYALHDLLVAIEQLLDESDPR